MLIWNEANPRASVNKRTKTGPATNRFGNELAEAVSKLGQVPNLGNREREAPWGGGGDVSLPSPQYVGMFFGGIAANTVGFDYIFAVGTA